MTTVSERLENAATVADETASKHYQVVEGGEHEYVDTDSGKPIPTVRNLQRQINEKADQTIGDLDDALQQAKLEADRADAAADRAEEISGIEDIQDALRLAAVPAPDFHLPLISDLRIQEGFGPADQIDVSPEQDGSVMVDLPTRSAQFSRASTATYINKSGELVTAGVNEPRFENEGLLIEGSSTNLQHRSDIGEWVNSEGDLERSSETQHGIKFYNITRISDDTNGDYRRAPGTTDCTGCTISIFARDMGEPIYFTCHFTGTPAGGTIVAFVQFDFKTKSFLSSSSNVEPGFKDYGDYVRLYMTLDKNIDLTPANPNILLGRNSSLGSVCSFASPQIEPKPIVSSFIPTAGAPATRAGDFLEIDANNNVLKKGYTQLATYTPGGIQTTYMGLGALGGMSYNLSRIEKKKWRHWVASTPAAGSTVEVEAGRSDVMAVVYARSNDHKVYVNGVMDSSEVRELMKDETPTKYTIPSSNGSGGFTSFHVRDFRVWHQALSDQQISALGKA